MMNDCIKCGGQGYVWRDKRGATQTRSKLAVKDACRECAIDAELEYKRIKRGALK